MNPAGWGLAAPAWGQLRWLCCVPKTVQVNLSSSVQTQPISGTARPCLGLVSPDSPRLAHAEEPRGGCTALANASTPSGPPGVY